MNAKQDIARKVAKLLLVKTPKEREKLTKVSEFLQLLYKLYRSEGEFRGFILNPTIPKENKLGFLKRLRERFGLGASIDEVIEYILEISAVPFINEIKRVYDYEVEKLLRVSKAILVLAKMVDDAKLERIKTAIRNFTGRDYDFEVVEDQSLIGGFIVKTSSFVVDASVKRELEGLLRR